MRQSRIFIKDKELVYHIISRTALDGYVLEKENKDYLLNLIYQLSNFYFMDVIAFCIMGNHFHLMVRNRFEKNFKDEEILNRLYNYYPKFRKKPKYWRRVFQLQLPFWREKLASISEFTKDLKQRFSRYYNNSVDRKGYFWGDRFKSAILGSEKAIRTCIAYIDLNPIRANLVEKPEDYPWSSIAFRTKKHFYKNFLSDDLFNCFRNLALDLEVHKYKTLNKEDILKFYIKYLYKKGVEPSKKGKSIHKDIAEEILSPEENLTKKQKLFSNGLVLGDKVFVKDIIENLKGKLACKKAIFPFEFGEKSGFFSLKGNFRG